jgi:hypothetical protein
MTIDDFEAHVTGLGHSVEPITGADGQTYTVIRSGPAPTGGLAGQTCDVAIVRTGSVPYVPPPAIHSRPALVPMGLLATQPSAIGPDWQYWSRRYDRPVTARGLWIHILTILREVA